MGRLNTRQPATAFGEWTLTEIDARGWERKTLAVKSGVGITSVNQIVAGVRNPSRDMVERLARALAPEDADEHTARALLNAGLKAAGFAPADGPSAGEHPAQAYLRGLSDVDQDRALRVLEVAIPYGPEGRPPALPPTAPLKATALAAALERRARANAPGLRRARGVTWMLDMAGRFLMSEGTGLAAEDLAPGQVVGLRIEDVYRDSSDFLEKVRMVIASDSPLDWTTTVRGQPWHCWTEPLRDAGGRKVGIVGASLEVPREEAAERQERPA